MKPGSSSRSRGARFFTRVKKSLTHGDDGSRLYAGALTLAALCLGIIYFTWSTLDDIQQNLPLTIVKQQRDIGLLLQDASELASRTGLTLSLPSQLRIDEILHQVSVLEQRLDQIRASYNFDNLVGASAIHAVISPALTDIKSWLRDGVYNLAPDSSEVISLVHARATNAVETMRSIYATSQWEAFDVLEQQAQRIQRFKVIIVFLILVMSSIGGLFVYQKYRLRVIGSQLQDAKEASEQANKAKTEFLAHMSHELRSPLNSIIGFSQMMSSGLFGKLNEKYVDYCVDIHTSAQHLLEVVSDILDIARIESGAVELDEVENDVNELAWAAKRLVRFRDDTPEFDFRIAIPERFPKLLADKRLVLQILVNLLSNSAKFTPEDGSIIVSANLDDKGCISISVRDTGIGIAKGDLAKVLEPFSQVRGGPNLAHKGTGLGLSLSKRFAEKHGGTLTIESELDQGTIVIINFPPSRTVSSSV
jgi:signal transduction histidine kinase